MAARMATTRAPVLRLDQARFMRQSTSKSPKSPPHFQGMSGKSKMRARREDRRPGLVHHFLPFPTRAELAIDGADDMNVREQQDDDRRVEHTKRRQENPSPVAQNA